MDVNSESLETYGFQATNLGRAISLIELMKKEEATIFLSFTANMVATGLRSLFAGMCKRKFLDAIITTGGSLDHDLIRSRKQYQIGDFFSNDNDLHKRNTNRLGNVMIKNECYEFLEEEMKKIFAKVYDKQRTLSPSEIACAIGEHVKDENSFLYWCTKNKIPVFCPGITDSAIGLQAYFFKQRKKDFIIDVTADMNKLASLVLNADKTGGIVLGGGISKHHTIGVNLLRGGLDYAVYVTTSSPWDGSLSGARTNEAISWGKINEVARHVTIDCDATIAFPLMMKDFLENHNWSK
jgi:deoxyhypusine synthase